MKSYGYEDRSETLGRYLIDHESTIRATAQHFGISKSTVHKDVSERLNVINPTLYSQVKIILDKNKSERHLRGGKATKEKYRNMSKVKKRG